MYSSCLYVFLIIIVTAEAKKVVDYHENVGIPKAQWIKETEDKIYARQLSGRRVVRGGPVSPSQYPFMGGLVIDLEKSTNVSWCGSTLITIYHLLTVAHCWRSEFYQASRFTVVLASEFLFRGGTRIATSKVLMHPQFNLEFKINDIAIIYLPTAVPSTDSIKPIDLPHLFKNRTFVDEWVYAVGYGNTETDVPVSSNSVMSHVRLRVITEKMCKRYFTPEMVTSAILCTNGAMGVGTCSGDSGGPLVYYDNGQAFLVGITSFGSPNYCEEGSPSAFTRVTSYLPFIMQNL